MVSAANTNITELHMVLEDDAGNDTGEPSGANNTIITGITVTAPSGGPTEVQVVDGGSSSSTASDYTFASAITIGSGSDKLAVVAIHGYKNSAGDTQTITSVTLGGVAMTQQVFQTNTNSKNFFAIYTLVNPTAGSKDVQVITGASNRAMAVTVAEYTGADQTNPITSSDFDIFTGSSASATTLNLTTSNANTIMFAASSVDTGTYTHTVTGDTTERVDGVTGGTGSSDCSYCTSTGVIAAAGAASATHTWGTNDQWAAAAIEIKAA